MRKMSLISNISLAIFIFSILIFSTDAQTNQTSPTLPPIIPFLAENIKFKEPISLFLEWMDDALKKRDPDASLAYLATVSKEGYPSIRPLALIDVDEDGFIFFTNYNSRKALDIANNPNVALVVYWKTLQRVVRVEGVAEKLLPEESEPLFRQRPRTSQIRILASQQSERIPNREYVHELEAEIAAKLEPNATVPLPNWGGFLIKPRSVEFWQGQRDYVNDRIRFRRGEGVEEEVDGRLVHLGEEGWVYERLAP